MLVTSPPPRSAWTPRAEPCTIFGAWDFIPDAYWVYQKGWIKPRVDVQAQGLSQDDLVWVKLNVGNWDPPDRPLELPLFQTMMQQKFIGCVRVMSRRLLVNPPHARHASRPGEAGSRHDLAAWYGGSAYEHQTTPADR